MTRQSMFQAKKESQPLKTSSLFRRQAAQTSAAEQEPAFPPIHLGQDYSAIPFKPVHPAPALGPSSISCPFTPQRCPFGGACHACPPKMQAKLKIGQPGDRYEQEADRVAEQVMRMPEPQVQRKCSAPGCKDEDEKKLLQTKPANAGDVGAQVDHPLIQNVLSSPGQPLDAGTRSFMEPRFGQDFSGVRVHVGGEAAESARAVNARAYTVGRDVVFGEGEYSSKEIESRQLLAHELVHVLQQGGSNDFNDSGVGSSISTNCLSSTVLGRDPMIQRDAAAIAQRGSALATLLALIDGPLPIGDAAAVIVLVITVLAVAGYWAFTLLMSKLDELVGAIETVADAIEEAIRNNPRAAMRCSAEVIAFREAKRVAIKALQNPAQHGAIQIVRAFEAFKAAVHALAICLGIDPPL